ncbi:MAG: DUF3078 domain-containing protein [Flavobacterium sp.]
MKSAIKLILFMLAFNFANSQVRTTIDTIFWTKKNEVGLDLSQISFANWNAGGNNSISGLLKGQFQRNYKRESILWNNELIVRYGINKQEGREVRKTDDVLQLQSNFGYRKEPQSNWYYMARFNFSTQFTDGFNYPNTNNPISRFMAPGFLFLGVGSEYVRKDLNLFVYASPMTLKTTFVMDQTLANRGAFGVRPAILDVDGNVIQRGARSRNEFGILINNQWKRTIYKNMELEHRMSLYTDYLNNFGNIDIDWQVQINMVVNEYVRANIGMHLIYDDDIKARKEIDGQQVTVGPKVQFKQLLGVGVVYSF